MIFGSFLIWVKTWLRVRELLILTCHLVSFRKQPNKFDLDFFLKPWVCCVPSEKKSWWLGSSIYFVWHRF
jgi:hypothetical protein